MNIYHVLINLVSHVRVFRVQADNGHALSLKIRQQALLILENPADIPLKDGYGLFDKNEPLVEQSVIEDWIDKQMSEDT